MHLDDSRADFDQLGAPRRGMALSQWIGLATLVEMLPLLLGCARFQRQFRIHARRLRRGRHESPQANQEIVRQRMHHQPKQIGHVAMVAQAIGLESALEFLVAVLALAAIRILIVGALRYDASARPIRHHGPAIGPLRMGFAFDDDPPRLRPTSGLILEGRKMSLRLLGLLPGR